MKKWISALCAALFLFGLMMPAMAEPSPGKLDITGVTDESNTEIKVNVADPGTYANSAAAEAVSNFKTLTIRGFVNLLKDYLPAGSTLSADGNTLTQQEKVLELLDYDWVTEFYDMPVKDEPAVVTMQVAALAGLTEADVANYQVLLVNPDTGALLFLDLSLNADGTVTANFPFQGSFALVQKVK